MYLAYLFDFDYTLGDATDGIVESMNFALEQMERPKSARDAIRKTVGMQLVDAYTYLTQDDNKENKSRFVALFKQKADVIMLENTRLFDDTETLLRKLKERNIKTAIVTTKYHYRMTEILNKYHITEFVDIVIGGEDVSNPKPDPEPLETAIKLLNVSLRDCIYIGDSIIDAETAYRANTDFIAVTTGTTQKEEFDKFPNIKIISRLSELLDENKKR